MNTIIKTLILLLSLLFAGSSTHLSTTQKTMCCEEQYLQKLIDQSTLDQKVSELTIAARAALIKLVISKLKTQETPQWLEKLQVFALYNCYAPVSDALYTPLIFGKNYTSRTNIQKKKSFEWEQNATPTILQIITKLMPKERSLTPTGKWETSGTINGRTFHLTLKFKQQKSGSSGSKKSKSIQKTNFEIAITEDSTNQSLATEPIGTVLFECSKKDGVCNAYLSEIKVNETHRQNGWGRILLATTKAVITKLMGLYGCGKANIALIAQPLHEALKAKLINWYKSFGFIPDKDYLYLYLDTSGTVLKKYDLTKKKQT